MVYSATFIAAAAVLAQLASAVPMVARDSSFNEPAVKAPDGTPITQTQQAMETGSSKSSSGCSGSSCGSNMNSNMNSGMMSGDKNMGSMGSMGSSGCGSSGCGSKDMGSSKNMGSSGCGSSGCGGSSSSMMESSTMAPSSTMSSESAMATSSSSSYSMPQYGSGSSSYGSGNSNSMGYNNCVQQCMASYMPPMGSMSMPSSTQSSGSSGNGATQTVIVAPSQGVLRFVPPILNASVGTTVMFMWGANNHTVTKSSQLTPCNKSADNAFVSGVQSKPFTFNQPINVTDPTFFYCSVPNHCQSGMFGILNPPNTDNSSSMGSMSSSMMSMMGSMNMSGGSMDSSSMSSMGMDMSMTSMQSMYNMMTMSQSMTSNNSAAANWGNSVNLASMPGWAQPLMMENIMFTRMFIAANPEVLQADGSINLSASNNAPFMIPGDPASPASNAAAAPSGSSGSGSTPAATSQAPAGSSGSASPAGAASTNGAGALASPRVLAGAVAILATLFAL